MVRSKGKKNNRLLSGRLRHICTVFALLLVFLRCHIHGRGAIFIGSATPQLVEGHELWGRVCEVRVILLLQSHSLCLLFFLFLEQNLSASPGSEHCLKLDYYCFSRGKFYYP